MRRGNVIYRTISIVILALCLYGLLLPVISPVLSRWFPGVWTCPFLRLTGQDCPFCGITRGFSDIYALNLGKASMVSMAALMVVLFEIVFRTFVMLTASGFRKKTLRRIVVFDIIIHAMMIVLLCIYVIMFLVNNF